MLSGPSRKTSNCLLLQGLTDRSSSCSYHLLMITPESCAWGANYLSLFHKYLIITLLSSVANCSNNIVAAVYPSCSSGLSLLQIPQDVCVLSWTECLDAPACARCWSGSSCLLWLMEVAAEAALPWLKLRAAQGFSLTYDNAPVTLMRRPRSTF